jgi:5-bromo-4-chloroindolyl phosphate hydrolysis protein
MQDKKSGCSLVGIVALVVVVGAMIVFSDFIKWILIGFGIIVAGLITLLIVLTQKEKKKKRQVVAEGTTLGDVERIIKESEARLQALRRNFYKLKDTRMQNELDLISNLFRQMFKIVKEDPKDIKAARRYINATFSSLETIVGQSVALFEAPSLSDEAKQTLENAAEGMVMIRKATEKQINKFYENNVLDLDVELTVLKKSLSSRGLLEEEKDEEKIVKE